MNRDGKRPCARCGALFVPGERRGDGIHGYNGNYCKDCDALDHDDES